MPSDHLAERDNYNVVLSLRERGSVGSFTDGLAGHEGPGLDARAEDAEIRLPRGAQRRGTGGYIFTGPGMSPGPCSDSAVALAPGGA